MASSHAVSVAPASMKSASARASPVMGSRLLPVTARSCFTRRGMTVAAVSTPSTAAPHAMPSEGPILIVGPSGMQKAHSLSRNGMEVIQSLSTFASTELSALLKPVDKCWQPNDFLPDPSKDNFLDEVKQLQTRAKCLTDDYLVVLVGDMITEEALPTYMNMINTLDGVRDETGAQATGWAKWTRAWTAEENRHGDLLNKYLYLTGRVDLKAIEVTIQNLIGAGMDPKTENNPYMGFIYTSFQERATKVSHGNTARHAKEQGDEVLAKICASIAADEGRHELAYTRIITELFAKDPEYTLLTFEDMMRKQITMPAHMMNDGMHESRTGRHLFDDFSSVAERTGTYTAMDYADIMEHLVKKWEIANLTGLTGEGAKAQDYVCNLPARIRKLAQRTAERKAKNTVKTSAQFSWVFDRTCVV